MMLGRVEVLIAVGIAAYVGKSMDLRSETFKAELVGQVVQMIRILNVINSIGREYAYYTH